MITRIKTNLKTHNTDNQKTLWTIFFGWVWP